jgi:hypothetical protein
MPYFYFLSRAPNITYQSLAWRPLRLGTIEYVHAMILFMNGEVITKQAVSISLTWLG